MNATTKAFWKNYIKNVQQFGATDSVDQQFPINPLIQTAVWDRLFGLSNIAAQMLSLFQIQYFDKLTDQLALTQIHDFLLKRTDVSQGAKRSTYSPIAGFQLRPVTLQEMEMDLKFLWRTLDHYARQAMRESQAKQQMSFEDLINGMILGAKARNLLWLAWNGTSEAANAMPDQPQTLLKGFIQRLRDRAPQNIMSTMLDGQYELRITDGAHTGDFESLDHLVSDLYATMSPLLQSPEDVVLMNPLFKQQRTTTLYRNFGGNPNQKIDIKTALDDVGGLSPIWMPYLPPDKVVITPLDNLAICLYMADDSYRVSIKDNDENKSKDFWRLFYMAYEVIDERRMVVAENIKHRYIPANGQTPAHWAGFNVGSPLLGY